ncbi:late endosomal/lysosomal adaptor, MAPK and MTOR activator 1 [Phyllostomus discolor]|uniref:Late endosomal/lysosomal adaptor, MAPK and MTOR activator 1 n=1 Tax=Phyllostomus discolor TaxID=89673 RepID=A0A834E4Y1_9CHIR|nr:late endosomal/lysosomal adaptor, MAPK and MTOR activator 1 [Phyllostomus discolor]
MGCCYSSENEDSDQDREERKLLLDPSSPPTKVVNGAESNNYSLPTVHFLRSVWMQERSWLYSLGSREDRDPWTALLLLFTLSRLHPASPGPQPCCGLYSTLTCY